MVSGYPKGHNVVCTVEHELIQKMCFQIQCLYPAVQTHGTPNSLESSEARSIIPAQPSTMASERSSFNAF